MSLNAYAFSLIGKKMHNHHELINLHKKLVRFLFKISVLLSTSTLFSCTPIQTESISSMTAVSQSGRFALHYFSPLVIDKERSRNLTNFIAYQNIATSKALWLGSIPSEESLTSVCQNPLFLKNEKIAEIPMMTERHIRFFATNQYQGCLINVDDHHSAIIVSIPEIFISQNGQKIKHIGVVAPSEEINQLKTSLFFQVSAKDFFINLLQLSQTFSPFSEEIDWKTIKSQGIKFIGSETKTCMGLAAAATFLTPELNKKDLHSFLTLNGLGTNLCPAAPLPQDEGMKKWFSIPASVREPIIKYGLNFHGKAINQRISYLYVPAIDSLDLDSINKNITDGRNALEKSGVNQACGLIIDLRFNTGGNFVPMLLTLGGVIPNGKLFSMGKTSPVYLSENGNALFSQNPKELYGQYIGTKPQKMSNLPVAILTNWMTGSSGNLTSVALRENMKKARVFGEKTSPTTSINSSFYLLDGNVLNLMVDHLYTSRGALVPLALSPDLEVENNLTSIFDPDADAIIEAAQVWLESLAECR
ncbi:MAG: peptidase [Solimicrobium sp.]|jgi:hypothetical protein|nr:peptidase [Solimicrobium sp.]